MTRRTFGTNPYQNKDFTEYPEIESTCIGQKNKTQQQNIQRVSQFNKEQRINFGHFPEHSANSFYSSISPNRPQTKPEQTPMPAPKQLSKQTQVNSNEYIPKKTSKNTQIKPTEQPRKILPEHYSNEYQRNVQRKQSIEYPKQVQKNYSDYVPKKTSKNISVQPPKQLLPQIPNQQPEQVERDYAGYASRSVLRQNPEYYHDGYVRPVNKTRDYSEQNFEPNYETSSVRYFNKVQDYPEDYYECYSEQYTDQEPEYFQEEFPEYPEPYLEPVSEQPQDDYPEYYQDEYYEDNQTSEYDYNQQFQDQEVEKNSGKRSLKSVLGLSKKSKAASATTSKNLHGISKKLVGIAMVLVLCLGAFGFFQFPGSILEVSGASMEPKFHSGDKIFASKMIGNVSRFDIVVVSNENTEKMSTDSGWIKRVIGLPGETITYKNGKLYINGKKVKQTFADNYSDWYLGTEDFGPITLGDDEYWVMGDNRSNSCDSRYVGAFKKEDIKYVYHFTIKELSSKESS